MESESCPQSCIALYNNAIEAGRMEGEDDFKIFWREVFFTLTNQELLSMKGSLID